MIDPRETIIHHGTPMTPRAALLAVLPGRAACVSFARPDDVEAVEAVCPRIMFRQWRALENKRDLVCKSLRTKRETL